MTPIPQDPHYCALLHKGLYAEKLSATDFQMSSCCTMDKGPRTKQIDFVNDTWLKEKRTQSLSTQIPECKQCWDLERSRGWSHRTGANRWLASLGGDIDPYAPELLRFDYNVDILCNAKCIQCSSWFSSLWAAEDQQHGQGLPSRTFNSIRTNNFDAVDVSKLLFVYFNGGEPLLSNQPEEFLLKIRNQKGLETVSVSFSTNGSVMPSQNLLALLKQCKKVSLAVSLDGVNGPFEYIRNPLIWKEVESNTVRMTQLASNIFVSFSNNIGIHNVDEVINMQDWYDDISKSAAFSGMHFLHTVGKLGIDYASKGLLAVWREKFLPLTAQYPALKDMIGTIDNAPGRPDDQSWLDHLAMIDQRRKLDWRLCLPNLYDSYKKIHNN